MPHVSKNQLLLHAGPVSHPKSALRDLVKVRMEMTYGVIGRPKFNLLCKSYLIKDISRWRATQEIQMEFF